MTTAEIEVAILNIIEEIYSKRYNSKLFVTELPGGGYSAKFALNNIDKPLVISAQLNATDFLKFMRQELRDKSLWRVEYSLGYKTYPEDCKEEDVNRIDPIYEKY
jgi:hypothetical protein|nr:MAG TPA: hypothetical protein [Caudoviricetes sp.]